MIKLIICRYYNAHYNNNQQDNEENKITAFDR